MTDADVVYIHEVLETVRRIDTKFRVPGTGWHLYQAGPPLSEADVQTLEDTYGAKLPSDYRNFLLKVGPGAGPGCGLFGMDTLRRQYYDEVVFTASDGEEWTEIGIGYYGGPSFMQLVLSGRYYGTVWEANGEEYLPTGRQFGEWYGSWLRFLKETAVPQIVRDRAADKVQVGMTKSEVITLCGPEGGAWKEYKHYGSKYDIKFDNLLTEFRMTGSDNGEEDQVSRLIDYGVHGKAW